MSKSSTDLTSQYQIPFSYRLLASTSEDLEHPLNSLLSGQRGNGWLSSRYCTYPQLIYLQFERPINLRQINIIIHETNIPSEIKIYAYNPSSKDEYVPNFKRLPYIYVGFIQADTNTRSNFKLREYRKIFIDINCLYLKLELGRNYMNRINIFNQVGLISLEFFGRRLGIDNDGKKVMEYFIEESLRITNVSDIELNKVCNGKIDKLKKDMENLISMERYDECKVIKGRIERIRMVAKKIVELEQQKKYAVNNEDFDTAKDIKEIITKMKINIENDDKMYEMNNKFNNHTVEHHHDHHKSHNNIEEVIDDNNNHNGINMYNNSNMNINISNEHTEIPEHINYSHHNYETIHLNTNPNTTIISNKTVRKQKEVPNDHDETIVPYNPTINFYEEFPNEKGDVNKGQLEDISRLLLEKFALFIPYIEEIGLRQLFSKQVLHKADGLLLFQEKLPEMFNSQDTEHLNNIITLTMELILILLEERHPNVIVKTLEIVKPLFECIRDNKVNLNIDYKITNKVLKRLKKKLGDVNDRVREFTRTLYCFMLGLDFCDYNNLITELVEEELGRLGNNYQPKSANLITEKLQIFKYVLDNFEESVKNERTSQKTFPYKLVRNYLIFNISHSNCLVRDLARQGIKSYIQVFGLFSIIKKIESIDKRELVKLVNEIDELKKRYPGLVKSKSPKSKVNKSFDNDNSNYTVPNYKKLREMSKNKSQKNINKSPSPSPPKENKCNYCLTVLPENTNQNEHQLQCAMFTSCNGCNNYIEVRILTNHKLTSCTNKDNFIMCKICKEAINKDEYDNHQKIGKCNPAKNPNSSNRCPLCHKDIMPTDKGFYVHLVEEGCEKGKNK